MQTSSRMTAQRYLLSQAEHCRRSADDHGDPFVAAELRRLADEFERKANGSPLGERGASHAA